MTRDEARTLVLRLLGEVAPEADLASLDPAAEIQPTLDLDSIDVMSLIAGASEEIGRDIPDADARRLLTVDAWVAYLADG